MNTQTVSLHSLPLTLLMLCTTAIIPIGEARAQLASECIQQIVPAYFKPNTSTWNLATSVPGTPGRVLIMNPASGPGNKVDSNYVTGVNKAKSLGAVVVGYVHTSYGRRASNVVKNEILQYKQWYGVNGIFIDETLTTSVGIPYYLGLAQYVRTAIPSGRVILNPGEPPHEGYVAQVTTGDNDAIVIFESSLSAYNKWTQPAWVTKYPEQKFSHLIYGVPQTTWSTTFAKAKSRRAGYVYITSDVLPNPWDTLPSYWQNEATAAKATCPMTP